MSTQETTPDENQTFDPERAGVQTLGHANRFALWDSEFRYDGRIHVPMGVKIKEIHYSYKGNNEVNRRAVEVKRGAGGTEDQYEIIDLTFQADSDVITFTLRGDLDVDKDPRPDYSRKYPIAVRVSLSDGTSRTVVPQVEVLAVAWNHHDREMVGRPFVRLPYDHHWGGEPNSQAGFGFVSDDGYIPDDKFIIDLVNPRQGVSDVPSNHSDSVYWQLVHEDGTPAQVSPVPQLLDHLDGHRDRGVDRNGPKTKKLPAMNLLKAGDKPGYYRFLVWPQSTDPDGKISALSWNKDHPEDAFQLGSVYFRYTAPRLAGFSVKPGGKEAEVKRGEVCYPGVELDGEGDGVVRPQTVVVTLPEGKGLHFTKEGNPHYVLKVQPHGGREKPYPGESEDGKSVTFKDVDLGLSGEGSFSRAWVAVLADHDAPLGETHLFFRVGSQSSNSNLIRVVENHKKP
jgi:hypothetical protein